MAVRAAARLKRPAKTVRVNKRPGSRAGVTVGEPAAHSQMRQTGQVQVVPEARIASAAAAFRQARVADPEAVVGADSAVAEPPPAEAVPERAVLAAPPAWVGAPVAVVLAAAGGGGKRAMTRENSMNLKTSSLMVWNVAFSLMVMACCFLLVVPMHALPQTQPAQKAFATPKEAADALIQAAGVFDVPALLEILGPDGKDLVVSEDTVQDKNRALKFAERAKEKQQVTTDPKNKSLATLTVGSDDWPLPIPIIKKSGKWYFDSKGAHDEILRRRIGSNELDAITVCRGYVEAQEAYARQVHDDSGVNQYAQRIISTPGKHDGLAWQNPDGTWGGPVGEAVAKAIAQGYSSRTEPFRGYYFKVLKGQGPSARLGQLDYVINGVMIGGFALVAWPADYRVTGVQTFIVSYDGVVYQKDLGPDSAKIAAAMERYDPDKTWHETDDDWR